MNSKLKFCTYIFFFRFLSILGLQGKITLRNLDNSPGLIPVKLGTAKVTEYTHTLLHYYDLNSIIMEINRLRNQSISLKQLIGVNKDYTADTANHLKILGFIENRVENKLKEILPQPPRIKRGLIDGLGSIFKSITGNLDANDGERYNQLILQLQQNQNKLASNIHEQNSLSLALIDKFNSTIQQISHNEILLERKIRDIAYMVIESLSKDNLLFINDVINQIITMFESISSILQDIENSIAFTKLGVMHPSIMKTTDLYSELQKLRIATGNNNFPIELTLKNIPLFEKFINIEGYISNNKVTYILQIPITYAYNFEYYHLYSIPIFARSKSQFKAIIPRNKFLIRNELHYAFISDSCTKISSQLHICGKLDLYKNQEDNPCEIELLEMKKPLHCHQTEIQINELILNQLEPSNQWITVTPSKETLKLKCEDQEEIAQIIGTYLIQIPIGCQVITSRTTITNLQSISFGQPTIFPNLDVEIPSSTKRNISIHLGEVNLDKLHELKTQIIENHPDISYGTISHIPSVWTILIYILLLAIIMYAAYKKLPRRPQTPPQENQDVQLPR